MSGSIGLPRQAQIEQDVCQLGQNTDKCYNHTICGGFIIYCVEIVMLFTGFLSQEIENRKPVGENGKSRGEGLQSRFCDCSTILTFG